MFLGASSLAFAGGAATPLSGQNVGGVQVLINGDILVQPLPGETYLNPDSCLFSNQVLMSAANPNFKINYALVLTAYATSRPLYIYVNGCSLLPWSQSATVPTIQDMSAKQ